MARAVAESLYGGLLQAVHGQRPGVPKKPDPTAVLETAQELATPPERVLYIGDSGVDMQTGRNAGMDTCGVLWGFRDRAELVENGAKYLAADAAELKGIIDKH